MMPTNKSQRPPEAASVMTDNHSEIDQLIHELSSDCAIEFSRVLRQIHLTHPARAERRQDSVMRNGFADESHFFNCALQFSTTVMGCEALSSTTLLTRRRWPSGAAAKLFLSPVRVD